jgi:hypothetical protein
MLPCAAALSLRRPYPVLNLQKRAITITNACKIPCNGGRGESGQASRRRKHLRVFPLKETGEKNDNEGTINAARYKEHENNPGYKIGNRLV